MDIFLPAFPNSFALLSALRALLLGKSASGESYVWVPLRRMRPGAKIASTMKYIPMTGRDWTTLGWFRVAVQILVLLAAKDEACTSSHLAEGLDAHAVFLRRVL